jgi:phosphoenolpyruvate carboxylase
MPSLWPPTDWPQRLAELQAPTGELKEAPLRRDVRSLGVLLGEVLREQAGLPLYEAVEDLRRTAIARRDTDATAHDAPNSTDKGEIHQGPAVVRPATALPPPGQLASRQDRVQ